MGYRVRYQAIRKIRAVEKRKARRTALTALCLLLFIILVNLFWPEGSTYIRQLFIPGDASVTVAAMESLAENLEMGEGIWSAMEKFIREVS